MLQEYYKTNVFLLFEKLNPKKVKSKIFPKEIYKKIQKCTYPFINLKHKISFKF